MYQGARARTAPQRHSPGRSRRAVGAAKKTVGDISDGQGRGRTIALEDRRTLVRSIDATHACGRPARRPASPCARCSAGRLRMAPADLRPTARGRPADARACADQGGARPHPGYGQRAPFRRLTARTNCAGVGDRRRRHRQRIELPAGAPGVDTSPRFAALFLKCLQRGGGFAGRDRKIAVVARFLQAPSSLTRPDGYRSAPSPRSAAPNRSMGRSMR